jgi:pseudouridine-5'-phosphate glycosidase/pseudouridine kinase
MAAHLAGAKVSLASVVADDLAGASLLEHVKKSGLSTVNIRQLPTTSGARTAQYVAVNDTNKDLVLAMADMSILAHPELEALDYWLDIMRQSKPEWVVVDANWSPAILSSILTAARTCQAMVAFEPVSIAKAAGLFQKSNSAVSAGSTKVVFPDHVMHLASPNSLELTAIYDAAQKASMFESEQWWRVVDSFGFSGSGSRDRLLSVAGHELVEEGIPQQCIQLLPFIPTLITKLGPRGCLLTSLLSPTDERLRDPHCAPYILSRNLSDDSQIGGVYMRLIPASCKVPPEEIVSVNGIGDTMLGVIVAGLVKGRSLEEVLSIAQDAAILSLKSAEAVSPQVRTIQARLG